MTARLPMGRIPTLYARTGDWFSWLCVAGLVTMLAVVMVGKAPCRVNRLLARSPSCYADCRTPTTAMTYIAIAEMLDGTPVQWMKKVTDEQYGVRKE